jgi:16S rRNA (adenine1518-N6/adenine1519-N6)-dimethyltransferase
MYIEVKPKQSLGQNFMVDANVADKIIRAFDILHDDHIVEIGPGTGILTQRIQKFAGKVTVVEIDQRLIPILKQKFEPLSHVDIIHQDFLTFDLSSCNDTIRLVGNIPYHITSPIFFQAIEHKSMIKDMTLLIQREVAERMVAKPRSKDYGILSVMAQCYSTVKLLFRVSSHVFVPEPKVESALVRWKFHQEVEHQIRDHKFFRLLVRTAFNQRRKMLRVSLKKWLTHNSIDFDLKQRPEELSVSEWIRLYQQLETKSLCTRTGSA